MEILTCGTMPVGMGILLDNARPMPSRLEVGSESIKHLYPLQYALSSICSVPSFSVLHVILHRRAEISTCRKVANDGSDGLPVVLQYRRFIRSVRQRLSWRFGFYLAV